MSGSILDFMSRMVPFLCLVMKSSYFFCLVKECMWYGAISSLIFCVELNHSIYCLMRYDTTCWLHFLLVTPLSPWA
jgi:hypothetical protein